MEVQDVTKPECWIVGTDNNVYALIGLVGLTLEMADLPNRAQEFLHRAVALSAYDEILAVCRDYVEVK